MTTTEPPATTSYVEVGPHEPLPPVTEDQLRRLGDILAAVDARVERERLAGVTAHGPTTPADVLAPGARRSA